MTQAQEILNLIENVKPDDTVTMNEIDARVWCYVDNKYTWADKSKFGPGYYRYGPKYTRSRDALKAIRPEGYYPQCQSGKNSFEYRMSQRTVAGSSFVCPYTMPTEELAELHAIIQSIEWERNKQ